MKIIWVKMHGALSILEITNKIIKTTPDEC